MRLRNAISSILLTLSLTLPFAGTWLWMEYAQYEAKEIAEEIILEGIPLDEQVILTFHKEDVNELLEWEHDREFEFAEEMYDVITRKEVGDSLRFWCLLDTRETAVKKQIQALLQDFWQQDHRSQDRQQQLISFGKQLVHDLTPSLSIIPFILQVEVQFPYPGPIKPTPLSAPPVPPPQHT